MSKSVRVQFRKILLKLSKEEMKALGAAIGTSGSSPMFMLLQKKYEGIELVDYTEKDAKEQRESNILKEEPDMILLGCPFYTLHEGCMPKSYTYRYVEWNEKSFDRLW